MRYTIGGFCFAAGAVFLAVNSMILFEGAYGFGAGHAEHLRVGLGLAAGTVPWVLAVLPFVISTTWKPFFRWKRPSTATFMAIFAWVVFVAYNLAGGAGVMATSRLETVAGRDKASETTAGLQSQRARLQGQVDAIPKHRPAATVERLVEAQKQDRAWSRSEQCTDATITASRAFCANLRSLEAEGENARAADRLIAAIAGLDAKLAAAAPVIASSDPQAELLHEMTGASKARIQLWLPAMTPIVLEVGAALTWYFGLLAIGMHHRPMDAAVPAAPVEPPPAVVFNPAPLMSPERANAAAVPYAQLTRQRQLCEWFWKECSRPVAGGVMAEKDWFDHYEAVCARSNDKPLPLDSFRRIASRHVPRIGLVEGVTHYFEVLPLIAEDAA